MRNPKEIEKTEYNEFYKKTFNEFLDPLAHTHFTTEVCGIIKYCPVTLITLILSVI
jgi:HSP90 family molecular chaperone